MLAMPSALQKPNTTQCDSGAGSSEAAAKQQAKVAAKWQQ
jgi:hypothetical protein